MTELPVLGAIRGDIVRRVLLGVGIVNALSAIGGGIGLLTPGSMGLPLRLIESTGLNSYLWPGIILLVVIGGTQTVAVVAELRHRSTGLFWSAVAGLGMLIWIFVELAIMGEFTPLHGIYFVTGMAQVVLVLALLGVLPGAVGPTGPTTRR